MISLHDMRLLILGTALALAACGGDEPAPASGDDKPTSTNDQPAQTAAAGSGGAGSPARPAGGAPQAGASSTTRTATAGTSANAGSPAGAGGSSAPAAAAGTGGSSPAAAGTGAEAGAGAGGQAATAGAAAPGGVTTRPAATSFDFSTTQVRIADEPVFNITRPEDLAAPGFLLPVIVWANGGCFRSDFTWKPLFDRWAKAGFVVLSLTGSGDENDIASMLTQTTKTDHAALIDWVYAQNETGEYAGKLDLERIIVAGNSCGGVTALEVAAEDDRLAAVFVLSGSSAIGSVNTNVMKAIEVPVGYIVGGSEDIAGANAAGDYDAMNDGVPAMIVNRNEGDHQTVSTDPMIAPFVAEIALNWMDLAVYGTKAAHDALTSMTVCDSCKPGEWMLKQKSIDKLIK